MERPNLHVMMADEMHYPPPLETEGVTWIRRDHFAARGVHPRRGGGIPSSPRKVDCLRRPSGDSVHREVPVALRCLADRGDLKDRGRPRHDSAGIRLGPHPRGPVSSREVLDALPGKWHVSNAAPLNPGSHEGLMASAENRAVRGINPPWLCGLQGLPVPRRCHRRSFRFRRSHK